MNRMTHRNYVPQTKPIANTQPVNNITTIAPVSTVEQNTVTQTHVEVPVNQGQQGFWQCFVDKKKTYFLSCFFVIKRF